MLGRQKIALKWLWIPLVFAAALLAAFFWLSGEQTPPPANFIYDIK